MNPCFKIFFISVLFLLISFSSHAQCPGDIESYSGGPVSVWDVVTDASDNSYLLLDYSGTFSVGGDTIDAPIDHGIAVAKFDSRGSFLWMNTIAGDLLFTTKPSLAISPSGEIVVAFAEFNDANHSEQLFRIEAYNDAWELQWNKIYSVSGDLDQSPLAFQAFLMPYDMVFDSNSNLYVTGALSGGVAFGGTTLSTPLNLAETFLLKLDINHAEEWAIQSTGSTGRGRAWTIELDANEDIYIAGHFSGEINLGNVNFTATDGSFTSPYIAKVAPADGSVSWIVGGDTYGPSNFYDISFDANGDLYTVGSFVDQITIGGSTHGTQAGSNGAITKIDAQGNVLWFHELGGDGDGEYLTHVNVDGSGTVWTGGQMNSTYIMYMNETAVPVERRYFHYLFNISSQGSLISVSENEILSYGTALNSSGHLIMGDYFNSSDLLSRTVALSNRPKPVSRLSVDSYLLNPATTARAYYDETQIYQWYQDGMPIQGANADTLEIISSGKYQVEVSNSGGCSILSEEFLITDGNSRESDSLVLVDFFMKTNGYSWHNSTGWLVDPINMWHGISAPNGRVTEIRLPENNLTGVLPPALGNLTQLEFIDIVRNNVGGEFPESIWGITSLTGISMHGNSISGTISPSVGDLANLNFIDLGGNNFTGPLPEELFGLSNLEYIYLWDDQDNGMDISGTLSASIGNLTNLRVLSLSGNSLTGSIPSTIGSLGNLEELGLDNNQFTGPIPAGLGSLKVAIFNLNQNQLTGEFPADLANLSFVKDFSIIQNNISGFVPAEMWRSDSIMYLNLGFNPNLEVERPENIAQLNLRGINISDVIPWGGPLPVEFFDIQSLEYLDLGDHGFTGTIPASVGNMSQLSNLWLWNNQLTGAVPQEITNLTNLMGFGIGGNEITSVPDMTVIPALNNLGITYNLLDFDDIIPNLGIAERGGNFEYAPQNSLPTQYHVVYPGGEISFNNPYDATGNVYAWILNQDSTGVSTKDYNVTSADLSKLGGYYALISNPAVPDLVIRSPFYNLAFIGEPKSFTVDNRPGSTADFKSFYAGIYGTNQGDTLYVAGSEIVHPYSILLENQRTIIGPGYFLAENDSTQYNKESAKILQLIFGKGSDGSSMYGMEVKGSLFINNSPSQLQDTVKNISLIGNKMNLMSFVDDSRNITLSGNFINRLSFIATTLRTNGRSYMDYTISNNIIDSVMSGEVSARAEYNEMQNINFDYNVINFFSDSVRDVNVTNSIIETYEATSNTTSNNIIAPFNSGIFQNTSGNLETDKDFLLAEGSPAMGAAIDGSDAGIFGGGNPYILSGMPPVPSFYHIQNNGRIRINFGVKANDELRSEIRTIQYQVAENGNVIDFGNLSKFQQGDVVEYTFRPRLGKVSPGQTYELYLTAQDELGRQNVPTAFSFVAETVNVTGIVTDSKSAAVSDGLFYLFEVNEEGTSFDTLSVNLNEGAFSLNNVVIGDYLALGFADTTLYPDELPTYYERIELWEQADTLLIDQDNNTVAIQLLEKPAPLSGEGEIIGVIEEELDIDNGRVMVRGRVRSAGVSVRRSRGAGKTENDDLELVAYVYSDAEGEFNLTGLPQDTYYLNIQYPGYPMDESSYVQIEIGSGKESVIGVAALVDEGKITVQKVEITGLFESEGFETVKVYPNPTTNHLNVILEDHGEVLISLYSLEGNLLEQMSVTDQGQQEVQLNLSGYSRGVYILNISNSKGLRKVARVVIE